MMLLVLVIVVIIVVAARMMLLVMMVVIIVIMVAPLAAERRMVLLVMVVVIVVMMTALRAQMLMHRRGAGVVVLLPLSAMIATPLFGLLADKIGRRASLLMFGSVLLMPVYLSMAHTDVSLFLPVSLMGIAFSLIPAVMWPSVAYIVEQSRLGTAYALMTLFQQLGFFGLNLLIGKANVYAGAGLANPGGYALGMSFFLCWVFWDSCLRGFSAASKPGRHAHGLETITIRGQAAQ